QSAHCLPLGDSVLSALHRPPVFGVCAASGVSPDARHRRHCSRAWRPAPSHPRLAPFLGGAPADALVRTGRRFRRKAAAPGHLSRSRRIGQFTTLSSADAGCRRGGHSPSRGTFRPRDHRRATVMSLPTLSTLITDFFLRHLAAERNVSPHTTTAYRDALKLLLRFTADHCHR